MAAKLLMAQLSLEPSPHAFLVQCFFFYMIPNVLLSLLIIFFKTSYEKTEQNQFRMAMFQVFPHVNFIFIFSQQ